MNKQITLRPIQLLSRTLLIAALLFQLPCQAVTYSVLHSFSGADGARPRGSLVMDKFGNLYGTTVLGGQYSKGTIFKLTGTTLTTVHHFADTAASDGSVPTGALVADNLGNLYGTTEGGGPKSFGTVFRWDIEKGLTTLYRFTGLDGEFPHGLTRDAAGNLYGATQYGGATQNFPLNVGYGVIYRISPSGKFTRLHSFNGTNGASCNAPLLRVGNQLYGTTVTGGAAAGNVFKISDTGTGFTVVQNSGGAEGYNFSSGLTRDPRNQDLYGTVYRGTATGAGGIYRVSPAGVYTLRRSFSGPDGAYPNSTLVADRLGNFYGMTQGNDAGCTNAAGLGGYGNIFKYDANFNLLTNLHTFNGADGANPCNGELFRDPSGSLYGVTEYGGAFGLGVIFKVEP